REAVAVRMPVTFHFEQQGAMVSMTQLEIVQRMTTASTDYELMGSWVTSHDKLDRPLTVTKTISPVYPDELLARREPGEVTIDFFVDQDGRVRLPAADPGTHPSFARNAVAALR